MIDLVSVFEIIRSLAIFLVGAILATILQVCFHTLLQPLLDRLKPTSSEVFVHRLTQSPVMLFSYCALGVLHLVFVSTALLCCMAAVAGCSLLKANFAWSTFIYYTLSTTQVAAAIGSIVILLFYLKWFVLLTSTLSRVSSVMDEGNVSP